MNSPIKEKILVACAISTTIITWSSTYIGIRVGLTDFSPGALALLRFLSASVCMLFILLGQRNRQRPTLREFSLIMLLGIIGFTFYNIALNSAEITVSASIASFIIGIIPVAVIILALIFLNETLVKSQYFGILISIIGVIVISLSEHSSTQFNYGVIYCLVAILCNASYQVISKPLFRKFHPIELTTYAIWSGTLFLLPYSDQLITELPKASFDATAWAIYLGIFPAALGYLCWSYVFSKMRASSASSFLYFMPLVATLLGWWILGEIPAELSLIGGFITLLGAILASIKLTHLQAIFKREAVLKQ